MIVSDYLKAFIGPPNVVRVIRELQNFDQMTVKDLGGLSKGVFPWDIIKRSILYSIQFKKRKRALPIGQKMSSDQGMDLANTDFHIMF